MNKFFNNIGYKNKVLCFSSLFLTTSIVCPLTSCGSDDTSNDIGGFDKEFGFDAQTYNRLEKQFTSKYIASLLNEEGIDKDTYINKLNNFLQNDLAILRNKLFDPAQNYSFTVRTNTLLDYASKNFNIQLNRDTNISQIDFDNLKQASLENFVIYMENIGLNENEINDRKEKFIEKFETILNKYISKTDDKAQILMQLRADVIECWQDVNDEIAYLSTYNHLKNFFDEYEFIVKDQQVNNTNTHLWDCLLKTPGFMGDRENVGKIDQDINHEISDYWINKLFTISKKTEKKEDEDTTKNNNLNDPSSDKVGSYDKQTIIPGFILIPVLKTMSQDNYSNNYYMNIDWQLMYTKYKDKDQETKNKVTAHLAFNKNGKPVDYADFKDGQLPSDNYQFTKYNFKATPNYQREKMIEAYFDQTKEPDQKITFSWDKDKLGIEYFLPSNVFSGENGKYNLPQDEYKVPMTENNLSLIGLKLNNINLSDLLNKQKNLQDNQSTNDDNLTIEEKFVKYCDINANAIVEFNDTTDISKNNISNKFINVYKNTNLPDEVKIEQDLQSSNITKSKKFANNAVLFFNNIVNFVDTNKITTEVDTSAVLTGIINAEVWIMFSITVLYFLEVIRECIWGVKWYKASPQQRGGAPYNPIGYKRSYPQNKWSCEMYAILITIIIIVAGLIITWNVFIYRPICKQNQNVKKWNDEITNKSISTDEIKIINNVSRDENNFKSSENFDKYFENNQFDAFRSFFYYSHFNHFISKNDEESSNDDMRKEIDNDYNQFIKKKEEYDVTIDKDVPKYLFIITASIAMILLIIWFIVFLWDFFQFRNAKLQKQANLLAQYHNQLAHFRAAGHVLGHIPQH